MTSRIDYEKRNRIKYTLRNSTKTIKEIALEYEASIKTVCLLRKEVQAEVRRPAGPPNAFSDVLDQLMPGRARPKRIPLKIDLPGGSDALGDKS